jgi:hypothetical protein
MTLNDLRNLERQHDMYGLHLAASFLLLGAGILAIDFGGTLRTVIGVLLLIAFGEVLYRSARGLYRAKRDINRWWAVSPHAEQLREEEAKKRLYASY